LLAAWKALPFHRRDRPGLLNAAHAQHPELESKAIAVLDEHVCDLKRRDAETLLKALRSDQIPPFVEFPLSSYVRSTQVERLTPWINWKVRDEPRESSHAVADTLVLATARFLWGEFPAFHRYCSVRAALCDAGIAEPNLPQHELPLTLQPQYRQALLNLLLHRGWIEQPQALPQLASELNDDPNETDPDILLTDLISRTSTGLGCLARTAGTLIRSRQGEHWRRVALAAQSHLQLIQQHKRTFEPAGLNPEPLLRWCREHLLMGVSNLSPHQTQRRWTLAMLDRGFTSETKLVENLAEVFPYAQMISDPLGLEIRATSPVR
jgi:hypothetical protein